MSEISNYTISKLLGEGQFGKVYKVKDNRDEITYALKIIPLYSSLDQEKSLREAKALASIAAHKNIVQYFHCWIEECSEDFKSELESLNSDSSDMTFKAESKVSEYPTTSESSDASENQSPIQNCLYIKTQLCEMTLKYWMESVRPALPNFDYKSNINLFIQISVALKFINFTKKLIHRDLKPENIFVNRNGNDWNFKIGDFGLVTLTTPNSDKNISSKYSYGTTPYCAPEMQKMEDHDMSVDVFSLGVIFLEYLFPMKTIVEKVNVVEELQTGVNKIDDKSFVLFKMNHEKEILKIKEMIYPNRFARKISSKAFHIWLNTFREGPFPRCLCHHK